jgi:hypothetical protein
MSFSYSNRSSVDTCSLFVQSALYRELSAEREEILRHKWIESEKAGRDIGFEQALVNWILHHRANWRATRRTAPIVELQTNELQ